MRFDLDRTLKTALPGLIISVGIGLALTIAWPRVAPLAPALAQVQQGPAVRGRLVADRMCSYCHRIDANRESVVEAGAPSFMTIANRPGRNAEFLQEFTTQTHIVTTIGEPKVPMPTTLLTPDSRDDVIAYILTFQRDPASGRLPPR